MSKQAKTTFFLILALCIPVAGYALMHVLVFVLPVSDGNIWVHVLYFALTMFLGLAIPYVMMKSAMHRAHLRDPSEGELELKNIGKDKDQLAHTRPSRG